MIPLIPVAGGVADETDELRRSSDPAELGGAAASGGGAEGFNGADMAWYGLSVEEMDEIEHEMAAFTLASRMPSHSDGAGANRARLLSHPQAATLAAPLSETTNMLSRLITSTLPRSTRSISSSAQLLTATPSWQELIGGRAGVERKKAAFHDKYADALKRKAEQEGLTQEQLMERVKQAAAVATAKERELLGLKPQSDAEPELEPVQEDPSVEPTPGTKEGVDGTVMRPAPSATKPRSSKAAKEEGPVKVRNARL